MNQKEYNKKFEEYIKKLEKFYDKYVQFYNSHSLKISAFSELSNIYKGISEIREYERNNLKLKLCGLKYSFLRETVRLKKEGWSTPFEEVESEVNKIDSKEIDKYFDKLLDEYYGLNDIEVLRKELIEMLKKFGEFENNRIYSDSFESSLNLIADIQKITPNYQSLRSLKSKILINEFPPKIDFFNGLSEEEKEEITKVGNRDWIDEAYTMPKGFFDKAKTYTNKKEAWDQRSIYDQLITDFKSKWNGKEPSFSTIHRRLKENNIW